MITLRLYSKEAADRLEAALAVSGLRTTDLGRYAGQGQVYEVSIVPTPVPQFKAPTPKPLSLGQACEDKT